MKVSLSVYIWDKRELHQFLMTPASCSKTESSHSTATLAARTVATPPPPAQLGCVALWLHEIKYTVDFRLCCVCSLLLHQFQAKLVESSFTILGIIFQAAKDCNILCYCVQVQSISALTASLRQLLRSKTSHSFSDRSSLTNSTIPTIYI